MKPFIGLLLLPLLLENILAEEVDEFEEPPEPRSKWKEDYGDYNYAGQLYYYVAATKVESDQGLVISPLGVSQVLGLLLFAAGPKTALEIDDFLYPKNASASGLDARPLLQSGDLTSVTVAALRPDVYIDPDFLKNAAELDSFVYRTPFAQRDIRRFNSFLKLKSHGKFNEDLQELFEDYNPANRLLFFNILDFRAQFKYGFEVEKRVLSAKRTLAWHGFIPELRSQVLGLSLKDSSALLLILLPSQRTKIEEVERRLPTVDIRKLRSRLNITLMNIILPRVQCGQLLNLREPLQKAGIITVFIKTAADLDAFKTELPLDDVIVYTEIDIFTRGINAERERSEQLKVDSSDAFSQEIRPLKFEPLKPFIYAVVDSHHVYLMGRHFPAL
ncbi:serpin I2-like [Drosophila ficusphila]|uniref:serpin I2-like n=1 Tax=Drosophila ficusphila TaxID=30025 RepID=UPI0007E7BCCD|nr:serpin I2-like [Drosophila ficusphila]